LAIARSISPNDSEVLDSCGYIYRRRRRWREALEAFQRAQDLDPQRAHIGGLPDTLRALRQWDAANEAYQHALQLEPQQANAWIDFAHVQFAQTGDPAVARATLDRLPESLKNKSTIAYARWDYAMLARDFAAAQEIDPLLPKDELPNLEPPTYYEACIALVRGDRAHAHDLLEQIRPEHEAAARAHPNDPAFLVALGNLYALLGRKDDAIRESRRALELVPEDKDALARPGLQANLAFVYAQTGEVDQAVALLSRLLTTPGPERITLAHLRASWEWDPLRNDPRFQKILENPEPVTIYH